MSPPRSHPGDARPRLLWTALATLAALAGLLLQVGVPPRHRELPVMVGMVLLVLVACLASVRRARRPGQEALGWRFVTGFLFLAVFIQVYGIYFHLAGHAGGTIGYTPFVLSVTGSLLQVLALLAWQLSPRTRFERIRRGLDGLLFAIAVFFVVWCFVLGPLFLSDQVPVGARFLWLATFLAYDLLLGLTVYLGLPEPARFRGPLGWLAAAFLLASFLNFFVLLQMLEAKSGLLSLPAGLTFAIPLAYLGAALSPRPVGAGAPAGEWSKAIQALPYVPVVGATVLGVWLLVDGSEARHHPVLVWLALGMVVVLLVRQYLAVRDFALLSQHLETRVEDRTRDLEKAQAMLLRTERMNTMATLGAGLAHDMNNLLSAVQSRAELVLIDLDEGRLPDRLDLIRIQETAHRMASMSTRLMSLGRQDPEQPRAMELTSELAAIRPLLNVLLPGHQTLRLETPAGPVPFLGTRGLLEQILVNLVCNARDAMPSGGTITLRARAARADEGELGPLLEVEDTGTGIPPELHGQVFQPFFTTKASGSGTGLGLVSVKSLLEKAGGTIGFATRPGAGAVFQIRLPRLG